MSEPRRVSPEEALRLVEAHGYRFVDVRSEPEFDAGHPAGAYNVPISRVSGSGALEPNPDFLSVMERHFPRETPLVVGCRSGGRSLRALHVLRDAGYEDVVDQRAGFEGPRDAFGARTEPGWSSLGLPVAVEAEPGRDYASLRAGASRAGDGSSEA